LSTKYYSSKDWALVLGASSGFGGTSAIHLAKAGMNIFGVHLDRKATIPNVEKIIEEIKNSGSEAIFFNINAADAERRKEVIEDIQAEFSKRNNGSTIKVLLHSLAFGALKPFIDDDPLDQKQMEMTLDVMANSLVYWAQDLVAKKLIGYGGRIYTMTSAGSIRVWKSYGAVSAAKSALESHIRQLALELAPLGITANAIRAGVTDTPALRKIPGNEQMIEIATKKNPHKRLTTPEDIGKALVAFSLPETQWMTGNVINVDGGENIVE
jgi:NAD(P)-dependent dehydrogenase (short-subunit alcohol dehydrogenase family)